jgi:hypothetical protein
MAGYSDAFSFVHTQRHVVMADTRFDVVANPQLLVRGHEFGCPRWQTRDE